MAREGSVAPQERVNITYKPATGNAQEEVELPLRMLFLGDYTGKADPRLLEERKPIGVDKDNFDQVLAEHKVSLDAEVADKLAGDGGTMKLSLKFRRMADFSPDSVVQQVPQLKRLLDLREALTSLKGPLGNVPAFRKKIQSLLQDEATKKQLLAELGLGEEG